MGSILELTIELQDGQNPVKCLAKVLRIEELPEDSHYDIGVCFLDIAGSDRLRLNKYIEKEKNGSL